MIKGDSGEPAQCPVRAGGALLGCAEPSGRAVKVWWSLGRYLHCRKSGPSGGTCFLLSLMLICPLPGLFLPGTGLSWRGVPLCTPSPALRSVRLKIPLWPAGLGMLTLAGSKPSGESNWPHLDALLAHYSPHFPESRAGASLQTNRKVGHVETARLAAPFTLTGPVDAPAVASRSFMGDRAGNGDRLAPCSPLAAPKVSHLEHPAILGHQGILLRRVEMQSR